MRILGIDPGTTRVGYGLIEKNGNALTHCESGILKQAQESTLPARLRSIEIAIEDLLLRTKPDRVGIEKLFFTKNQKTAMDVAQARGVVVSAVARHGIPVVEFSPSAVKLSSTGDGRATKSAVARMVFLHLHIPPKKQLDDITDALAIAIAASARHIDI